jgi:hypothetical protein
VALYPREGVAVVLCVALQGETTHTRSRHSSRVPSLRCFASGRCLGTGCAPVVLVVVVVAAEGRRVRVGSLYRSLRSWLLGWSSPLFASVPSPVLVPGFWWSAGFVCRRQRYWCLRCLDRGGFRGHQVVPFARSGMAFFAGDAESTVRGRSRCLGGRGLRGRSGGCYCPGLRGPFSGQRRSALLRHGRFELSPDGEPGDTVR